jgi:hypothetical protein
MNRYVEDGDSSIDNNANEELPRRCIVCQRPDSRVIDS